MTGQTRKHSLFEAFCNIAVGYGVSVLTQIIVFPWFGFRFTLADNIWLGVIFTVVSLIRSYCLRRLFNWIHLRRML